MKNSPRNRAGGYVVGSKERVERSIEINPNRMKHGE